ncbi:protein OSCP1a isoform X3 [Phycodurus eques]|nr:protein OSCP1a isoform X3 [Phycodurus eques]XP_061520585.1 protein OSCP1a isoform X3 [Phycodurus eques]
MKVVLTRLAHVSIMKLKTVSMEKLYELMIMAFKYQVFHCPRPKDLLLISYNHIDTIREFVKDTPALVNKVDETHRKIIEVYSSMTSGEFQLLRQTLLTFLQDMHIRVSIFLKNKIQNPNGRFALSTSGPVPHGMDVPGIIRIFDNKGRQMQQSRFSSGGSYTLPIKDASFGLHGDRVIKLGVNMYSVNMGGESSKVHSVKTETAPNLLAKEELNLLARLMGTVEIENVSASQIGFQINLFNSAQEEDEGGASGGAEESFGVINIQALQDEHSATQLAQIAGLFAEQEEMPDDVNSNKGDDLLAMMDDL